MRFLPWWRGRRNSDPAGNRLARFRKVLEAARTVPLYEASLRAAHLDSKKALRDVSDIESVLSRLGVFSPEQVRVRSRRGAAGPVVLTAPVTPGLTADLFWSNSNCEVLKPAAGPLRGLRVLFIRVGMDEGLLSPIERDGLWHRHGVPMFEHLVGMDGELLAWECETHCGLHIKESNAIFEAVAGELLLTSLTDLVQPTIQMRTGWAARIEEEPCDCGRTGRRLVGLRELIWLTKLGQKLDGVAAAAHN
jgi:hypothetical protein